MKTVRRIWNYARAVAPQAVRTPLDPLYAYRGRNVERFMLTIGYNRSGSSLIGQLLNAHPEVVVAHELYILQKLRALRFVPTPSRRGRLTRLILERDREAGRETAYRQSGYSYALDGLSQGEYSRLRVIGDKGSVTAAAMLGGARGAKELDRLLRHVRAEVRFLFTVRNPYDVLASRRLNRLRYDGGADIPTLRGYAPADSERPPVREEDVRWLLGVTEDVSRALAAVPSEDTLPVIYEEFIASPKESLRRICAFLGVRGDEDYLDACAAFTLPTQHRTRLKVRWTDCQIAQVAAAIAEYPWLSGYGFDD